MKAEEERKANLQHPVEAVGVGVAGGVDPEHTARLEVRIEAKLHASQGRLHAAQERPTPEEESKSGEAWRAGLTYKHGLSRAYL